jgi:Domain of unknown function (DUF1839)
MSFSFTVCILRAPRPEKAGRVRYSVGMPIPEFPRPPQQPGVTAPEIAAQAVAAPRAAAVDLDLSGSGARRACALPGLSAAGHTPHALHGADAIWPAANGHVDVWIEVLAQLCLDPLALWPCTVAIDFEGDQWTSFKPPHAELRALYGIDVQELRVWRPLSEHAIEHLGAGRLLSLEANAFWLPDPAGTDYRRNHAKTAIVLNELDLDARRMAYFHHAGYFEARGEDVAHLLGLEEETSDLEAIADWRGSRVAEVGAAAVALAEGHLPPFAEFIRTDRQVARSTEELQVLALHHLASHLEFRPRRNPVRRFAVRLARDLPLLREYGPGYSDAWASATVRQLGAAFEFAARGLAWQEAPRGSPLHQAAAAFEGIARDAQTLMRKLARAVSSTKAAELSGLLEPMAQAWDDGIAALEAGCRGCGR